MVFALAGDSTMTRALPPGVETSSSSGTYAAALARPRRAVALVTAFFLAAAPAPVFLAALFRVAILSVPSVVDRRRPARRIRPPPSGSEDRPAKCVRRSEEAPVQ